MATKFLNGIDAASQNIINVADPSSAQHAATKAYVDSVVNGLQWKAPVRVASTANVLVSNPGTAVFDGITLSNGERILLKSQTSHSEDGIYVFNGSAAALTRAADMDAVGETKGATVFVLEGSTNADKAFTQTAEIVTLGTTAMNWVQFGGAGSTYTAGNGLTESPAGTFNVANTDGALNVSANSVDLATGVAGAGLTLTSGVLAVGAGTGISVAADAVAVDTSVVVRKFAQSIGNGSLTSIAVTHNLGTQDVTVSVRDASSNAAVWTDWTATDTNNVTLTFATAPTSNQYRVVVHG